MAQRGNLMALAGKCDGTSIELFLDVVIQQKSNSWDVRKFNCLKRHQVHVRLHQGRKSAMRTVKFSLDITE